MDLKKFTKIGRVDKKIKEKMREIIEDREQKVNGHMIVKVN